MIGNKYYQINSIVKNIAEVMKEQCDPSQFQLQFKYAKLKTTRDYKYTMYLNQSKHCIVALANKPNCQGYKIHANATKQQYQNVQRNCQKAKLLEKPTTTMSLDLKFGRQKIKRQVGQDMWVVQNKGNQIKKQVNLLVDQKQFRLDLSRKTLVASSGEEMLKKNGQKLIDKTGCLRFKQQTTYHISPYYYIEIRQVYQTDQQEQKHRLKSAFKKNSQQQIQKYIVSNMPRNNNKLTQRQIQIKLSEEGISHLMALSKKQQEVSHFIGDLLMNFRYLSNKNYSVPETKSEMDKLNEQLGNIKIQ